MQSTKKTIESYFTKLGMEPEVAHLYLALNQYGPQTISELSRRSGIERTRIYRLLDDLSESHLIKTKTEYKRSVLSAAPVSNLRITLIKKEDELRELRTELQEVQDALEQQQKAHNATQVHFYKGPEGLKQMLWNQTRTTSERLLILHENMQGRTNRTFFEHWVRACNERGINHRGIVSDNFVQTQKKWYSRKDNERLSRWEARHVADSVFPIKHSTIIYDNIVVYYQWRDGDISGIEIVNQEIADAQRAFFAMLWEKAEPLSNAISQQLPE